jgi:hypothetical protein
MDIVKVVYREGKPFKLRMKSVVNPNTKKFSIRIIVFEMNQYDIEEDWNQTLSDPVLIENISEEQLLFIFEQLKIDDISPAKYPMSTFKNMASFFTFLIHHFINLYEINDQLNMEIVPEICPLVELEVEFLGLPSIVTLIHTEGNMFRIIISRQADECTPPEYSRSH